jgi:hypothetical protein
VATCPAGHESTATDYCDICGRRMGGSPAAAGQPAVPSAGETSPSAAVPAVPCPVCQTPRTGRFCEDCGYDFDGPPPNPQSGPSGAWTAVVTADREYFDSMHESDGPGGGLTMEFPAGHPRRELQLTGTQMLIGRRSAADGSRPDIDLGGPPADVGVSHRHALLVAEPDGTWSLVDQGSTNGTQLNGTEVAANVRTPLHDGDRISIGRWTVLTIRRT